MENMENFKKEDDDIFDSLIYEEILKARKSGIKPKLLLHACCAICSSHVLNILHDEFDITIFYYNPNIHPKDEFDLRLSELNRLIKEMNLDTKVIVPDYDDNEYFEKCSMYSEEKEGFNRCKECFYLRLYKTAEYAKNNNFDMFATTLSISPHKNSKVINEVGETIEKELDIHFAKADFKKKEGFKKANELTDKYKIYRQVYCGCKYSMRGIKDNG